MSKSKCASMTSSPLFMRVAELIVTSGPIDQVGCLSACSGVTSASCARVIPRNGPPLAVSTSRRTSEAEPERNDCANAECSESTATIWSGRANDFTNGPPMIKDSLFASARTRSARSASSVGTRPAAPAMPLSTTSHGQLASSLAESGPARILGSSKFPVEKPRCWASA